MAKILVSDPLPQEIVDNLRKEAEVEVATGLKPAELAAKLVGFDALIVRSQSKVTKEVIEGATQLRVIGRAGVGVDNIDVEAATNKGIMVINSPEGNTISAAEHTFGLLLAAARWVPQAQASMRPASGTARHSPDLNFTTRPWASWASDGLAARWGSARPLSE